MGIKYPEKKRGHNWSPGESGNPKGRPPGASNKVTRAVNQAMNVAFSEFIDNKFAEISEIYGRLSDRDKIAFYIQLLPYTKPRLMAVKQETTIKNETGAEHLSDSELTEFILSIDQNQTPASDDGNDTNPLNPNNHGDNPI